MPDSQIQVSVSLVEGRPATTSLKIAECFNKRHCDVMRDIANLIEHCPEDFHKRNFALMSRKVKIGKGAEREEPYYTVYFDGFMLLVMGYTGKKALAMKLAYIGAFNAMREQIEHVGNSEKLTQSDSSLTPDQQCTLRAIVKSRVEAIPEAERPKGIYPQVWSRFNNHFRIAKYCQLPQSRLSEAIDYLVRMEIEEPKALPGQKALPASGDKYEAYMLEVETARGRISEEISRLMDKGIELVDYRKFGPGCLSPYTYALADWLRDVLTRSSPVVDGWRKADRELNYSPVGIFQKMEKDFEFMKGK